MTRKTIVRPSAGRMRAAVPVIVLLLLLAAACGSRPGEEPAVPFPQPERIVSLSPAATEILFGLGVFDRVVGVSDYCTYPPEVENLPRLGSWQDANLEQLVLLEPDLVITGGIDSDAVSRQLADLGIATVAMPVLTLEDIFTSIESIGRAVGRPDRARSVTAETRTALDQLDGRVAGRPRPRVLLVVDRLPGTLRSIYTPTEASFLDELVRIAGGEPVPVTGGLGGYAGVSLEALVHLDPEIVIETIQGVPGRFTEDSMAVWGSLPELAAVRAGRVYAIRDTSVLHPSQRVRETAVRFAELIHPGVFPR